MPLPTKIILSFLIAWRIYSLPMQMGPLIIWPQSTFLVSSVDFFLIYFIFHDLVFPRISWILSHCFFFLQCLPSLLHLEKCNLPWMVPQKLSAFWKPLNTHPTHRINYSFVCWHRICVCTTSIIYVTYLAHSLYLYLSIYLSIICLPLHPPSYLNFVSSWIFIF